MIQKIIWTISFLSIAAGWFIIVGTAGASDCGLIMDFKTILIRCGLGAFMMIMGYIDLKLYGFKFNK